MWYPSELTEAWKTGDDLHARNYASFKATFERELSQKFYHHQSSFPAIPNPVNRGRGKHDFKFYSPAPYRVELEKTIENFLILGTLVALGISLLITLMRHNEEKHEQEETRRNEVNDRVRLASAQAPVFNVYNNNHGGRGWFSEFLLDVFYPRQSIFYRQPVIVERTHFVVVDREAHNPILRPAAPHRREGYNNRQEVVEEEKVSNPGARLDQLFPNTFVEFCELAGLPSDEEQVLTPDQLIKARMPLQQHIAGQCFLFEDPTKRTLLGLSRPTFFTTYMVISMVVGALACSTLLAPFGAAAGTIFGFALLGAIAGFLNACLTVFIAATLDHWRWTHRTQLTEKIWNHAVDQILPPPFDPTAGVKGQAKSSLFFGFLWSSGSNNPKPPAYVSLDVQAQDNNNLVGIDFEHNVRYATGGLVPSAPESPGNKEDLGKNLGVSRNSVAGGRRPSN